MELDTLCAVFYVTLANKPIQKRCKVTIQKASNGKKPVLPEYQEKDNDILIIQLNEPPVLPPSLYGGAGAVPSASDSGSSPPQNQEPGTTGMISLSHT